MAAVVQTFSQQIPSIAMIQARPNSATGRTPSGQSQANHQYAGNTQAPRTYHGNATTTGYRGSSTPVQQYAFTSTPMLNTSNQQRPTNFRGNTSPAPSPTQAPVNNVWNRNNEAATAQNRAVTPTSRHQPALIAGSSQPTFAAVAAGGKAAPDRYRRPSTQSVNHARSQSATLPATMQAQGNNNSTSNGNRPKSFISSTPGSSLDDMHLHQSGQDAKGLRRRSMHSIDQTDSFKLYMETAEQVARAAEKDSKTLRVVQDSARHTRKHSADSVNSSRSSHSRPSSANRNASVPTSNPSSVGSEEASTVVKPEQPKLVNIPPRGSSSDAVKRTLNPSPLSRPMTMGDAADNSSPAPTVNHGSPAAKHLAAINQKGGKAKSKTSRLRRAFSFGSAAELRKAGVVDEDKTDDKNEPSRLHKDPTPEEAYDAEQARIAEAQEAAGIGSSIYGGRFFGGSTDNLSISSTASSASIMIRKMGRGMKKSTRSLAGLFRPKSVVGVPHSEPVTPEASQAAVSMVTVEAETQRVNVSSEPQTSDNFPHLERNSVDTGKGPEIKTERVGSSGTDGSNARKSIVGGDRERAEVLAAVRKGILKRAGSASPSIRPTDASPAADLPGVPAITDSPNSSAPSTPNDDAQGHRRTGSVTLGSEDYFMTAIRLRQDTKSAPGTPNAGQKRNATFSPRIIFHDTWTGTEYDRRGEVATCNRLTPMLAQQIKEELNTFKMEMEVHENSKIYTHFF